MTLKQGQFHKNYSDMYNSRGKRKYQSMDDTKIGMKWGEILLKK